MKRQVFDVLRRGLDNAIANWPLILIRLGEALLFLLLTIGAIFAILVPILVSVGIQVAKIDTPDDIENVVVMLAQKWMLLVWMLLGVSVLLLVYVAIHSFVEAGCARVYVDAERIAGAAVEGPRSRFRLFSMDRWLAGATDGWWTLFWIYNLAWGAAAAVLLIPLIPTLVAMLLLRDAQGAAIAIGCLGLIATAVLALLVMIVAGIWGNRSIVEWAVRRQGARDALAAGWRAMRADLGRHVLVALAIFVVALAGSSFFASFSFLAAFGEMFDHRGVGLFMTMPLRMLGSLASSVFSAAVTSWYLASFASLGVEDSTTR